MGDTVLLMRGKQDPPLGGRIRAPAAGSLHQSLLALLGGKSGYVGLSYDYKVCFDKPSSKQYTNLVTI